MKQNLFAKLLSLLRQLDVAKIAYELRHRRDVAIMLVINVPGERWEVEFLQDGDIDVERFTSTGEIAGERHGQISLRDSATLNM